MPNLIEILKKILNSYDFDISEEYPHYVLGSKADSNVAAAILDAGETISQSDFIKLLNEMPPNLDKIIFVATSDISKELKAFAEENNILLWNKRKLEEEIGRAVLSDVGDEFFKESPKQELVGEAQISPEEQIPSEPEHVTSEMEPISVRIEPKQLQDEGELIMKPQVTMSEVSEISKKIVQGFRFDLELIPYYVFDYSCELEVEGQLTPQISQGTLAVNGLTNNAESWEFDFETVSEMETTHTKLEPKFDENRALETAREGAITLNTKEIQTVDDRGAVTIYEKKKVRPKEGAIDLQKRGLIYLPVWCVEGSNGVMIINATTGKVIKEDIYRESDDIYSRSGTRSFT